MPKLSELRTEMKEKGLDALIVLDELDQHYLSGFAFTDGLLLITADAAELITDFRYFEMAENRADKEFHVSMPEKRWDFIAAALRGSHTVGFEGASVSYATLMNYKEHLPDKEFSDIGDMIDRLRMIKTPEEIEKMQRAQDITDAAYTHILKALTPDMTEIEVAAELEYFMRRAGASGLAFDTIAVSGDASALPHGTPRNVKLKPGFLTMDYGARFDGYCSDMTRTIVIGKADEDIKKLYNTVLRAQLAAEEFLKAGVDCAEADKVARDIIDSVPEYRGAFGHSLGHSVGLFIHESPRLAKTQRGRLLRAGEVVTIEPGIYLMGKYGCRIEDMAIATDDGIRIFTHSKKDLVEIF